MKRYGAIQSLRDGIYPCWVIKMKSTLVNCALLMIFVWQPLILGNSHMRGGNRNYSGTAVVINGNIIIEKSRWKHDIVSCYMWQIEIDTGGRTIEQMFVRT